MKNSNTTITPNVNNKVLIITEKPSQNKVLFNNALFHNYISKKSGYEFYSTIMVSSFVFDYPNNIKYKEYPKSNDLKYKINPSDFEPGELRYNEREKTTFEFFSGFDELILSPDPDHTGVYSAILTLEKVLGENWKDYFEKITYIKLYSYSTEDLNKQFSELFSNDNSLNKKHELFYDEWYRRGKIKRYFEYNYNINSNIFFKEILKNIGIKVDFTLSKYTIMMFHKFYTMVGDNGISEVELLDSLNKHNGSGKYTQIDSIWCRGIGGPASRWQLTRYLEDLEFIERKVISTNTIEKDIYDEDGIFIEKKIIKKEVLKIFKTDIGEKFLSLSSKKTFDTDLVFRLNQWMTEPYEKSKINIDLYLKNMFTEQKRKNKYL